MFPIPAGPRYHIRPIHVDDYAAAVVDAVGATGTFVRDAIGPDPVEFGGLVESLVPLTAYFGGSGTPISAEVEHRFRRKWNTDSGKWNTDFGMWNTHFGGSGTPVPES